MLPSTKWSFQGGGRWLRKALRSHLQSQAESQVLTSLKKKKTNTMMTKDLRWLNKEAKWSHCSLKGHQTSQWGYTGCPSLQLQETGAVHILQTFTFMSQKPSTPSQKPIRMVDGLCLVQLRKSHPVWVYVFTRADTSSTSGTASVEKNSAFFSSSQLPLLAPALQFHTAELEHLYPA